MKVGNNLSVEKAISLAVDAHAGQKDKSGKPYILHPLAVMLAMDTEEEMLTAILHDAIEDTELTRDDLRKEGFAENIIEAISVLTHEAGQPYEAYLKSIKMNPLSLKVKLADVRHNLSRLDGLTPEDKERLRCKYENALQILGNGINQ